MRVSYLQSGHVFQSSQWSHSREIQLQSNKDLSLINKNWISNNQGNANVTCIARVNITNIHIAER